jgi:hypothetical protein
MSKTFESTVGEDKVTLKFKDETLDVERKCDLEYHIAYTELIQRGIMPKATLEKMMANKDIWTPKDEDRLEDLQRQLAILHVELEAATTHEKGLGVANQMGLLRAECLTLVEVKAAVLSNSCESLADNIRRDAYLAYATVYAETNKTVFKDYHDFLTRAQENEKVVMDAREAMLVISSRVFTESLTGLPEITYVRMVEGEILESAQEVVATATKAKKKAARKKKTNKKKRTSKKTTSKKKVT